jgi:dihydrofolate reductase
LENRRVAPDGRRPERPSARGRNAPARLDTEIVMPPRVSVFIAVSLDGFISRLDGGIDWLSAPTEIAGEDYGYAQFTATVDLVVLGRLTFEAVLGFPEWPYGNNHVHVLTSGVLEAPKELHDRLTFGGGDPAELILRPPLKDAQHIYLDGGVAVRRFLSADLVDDLTITRLPILLGAGRPLFGKLPADLRFEHVATRSWPNGNVQSLYRRPRG